jgi:hypothetical protein
VPALALPATAVGLALLAVADALPAAADEAWVLVVLPSAAVAGAGLLHRAPGHPLGRLLLVVGAASATAVLSNGWAEVTLGRGGRGPTAVLAGWAGGWVWALTAVPLVGLLPLLLPDGRLPSRAWRVVVAACGHHPATGRSSHGTGVLSSFGIGLHQRQEGCSHHSPGAQPSDTVPVTAGEDPSLACAAPTGARGVRQLLTHMSRLLHSALR